MEEWAKQRERWKALEEKNAKAAEEHNDIKKHIDHSSGEVLSEIKYLREDLKQQPVQSARSMYRSPQYSRMRDNYEDIPPLDLKFNGEDSRREVS